MSDTYIGSFLPVEEGGYIVLFKDFPEANSQGETISECVDMGEDIFLLTLKDYATEKRALPEPSTYDEVLNFAEEEMKEEGYDHSRKAFFQAFPVPRDFTETIRLSISMRKCDVDYIDKKAARMGMNRSEFIVYSSQACPERITASA